MSPQFLRCTGELRRRNVTVLVCKLLLRRGNEALATYVAVASRRRIDFIANAVARRLIGTTSTAILVAHRDVGAPGITNAKSSSRRSRIARGFRIASAAGLALALLALTSLTSSAQVVQPPKPAVPAPWNAQEVFEPVPFAQRWEAAGPHDEILPEDTPVKTRTHPGYEPVGVRAGSWMFIPSLTTGAFYDSNVFSTSTNHRSDLALRVHPSLLAYTLTERHSLAIQADMQSDSYLNNPGLNQLNASINARGRVEVRHDTTILTHFRAAQMHDSVGSLNSPTGAVEPTPYTRVMGDATLLQNFNRFTASVGARIESYDFGSTRAQNGSIIDQSSRDGQIYTGHGRLEYVFSPAFGVFSAVEGNKRDLRGTPGLPLSSDGYRALGGINLGLSRLLVGELGVGYADQRFDAATIGRVAGPAYRALLTWSPTRTIDVKFKAESIVTQSSDTTSIGIRADALQIGVDYEFRRNVVISLAGIYEKDRFFGQTRVDNNYISLAEIKYLLNRHWSISLRHRYTNRTSNFADAVYDKHEIGLYVTGQF